MADEPCVIYNSTTQTCLTKKEQTMVLPVSHSGLHIPPQTLQVFSYLCLVTHTTSHFLLLVLVLLYIVCVCMFWNGKNKESGLQVCVCVTVCYVNRSQELVKDSTPSKWLTYFVISHVLRKSEYKFQTNKFVYKNI